MGLDAIRNYLEIPDSLGTGGQPAPRQFRDIAAAGYEVVINLAMSDSTDALPQERELVTGQGMTYVHIPVVWESPTASDLDTFFETMARYRDRKVFVHCVLNYRVSVFVLLYRVLRLDVRPESAWPALRRIWEPNDVWMRFAEDCLGRHRAGAHE